MPWSTEGLFKLNLDIREVADLEIYLSLFAAFIFTMDASKIVRFSLSLSVDLLLGYPVNL